MTMTETQLNRYLDHLQLERQAPSFEYLRKLTKRHLQRCPFENVSKLHYYLHRATAGLEWLPDLDTHLTMMANEGAGGNCYILNAHFGGLLSSLGFQTDIVRATGGNVHLALKVTAEGTSYYVDVGYGAPLFEPVAIQEQPRISKLGEEIEITELEPDRYLIDRRSGGQSFVTKTIEWSAVPLGTSAQAITHSLRDEDDNPFMRRIVATAFRDDTAYSVVNRKLAVKTNGGTEIHEFTAHSEWMAMMHATFGLNEHLLEEAVDFLSSRGVDLFQA